MSLLLATCLLLAGTSVYAIPSFTREYAFSQQLMSDYTIYWTVNLDAQEIYLGFKVQTTGWFGFGLGEPESGSMPGADIMTAFVSGTSVSVTDRFSTAKALPPADTSCQDWKVVSGAEADGWTVVEVTRALDTGDKVQDRVFFSGSVPVIFSHSKSNSDTLSYHGTFRGTGFITFYGEAAAQPSDLLQDPNVIVSFPQISSYQIPAQQTTYICQSFELPIDQIRHIIAFEPVINATDFAMVHHTVIHGCLSTSAFWDAYQTPGQCETPVGNIESQCSDVLFAWARGGEPFFLPSEAGFRVSDGSDGGYYKIILQMHYDNPKLVSTAVDNSGFKIYMTNQLRTHDAGEITLGDPFVKSHAIPANTPYTEFEYACSPTCTSKFQTPLQVFSSFPHMHMYGNRIWTSRWRNGVQLADAVRTEYFAWTIQKTIPVSYTILPGDRLHTHCGYDTTGTTAPVTFGKNSTQEMCMEFVFYWPKQKDMFYCGGAAHPALPTNLTVCGTYIMSPTEANNPARFGFDPAVQRLRQFGSDFPDTNTCATKAPTTPVPTDAPTTLAPTQIPTTIAPTDAPTDAPTTPAPTDAPTTDAPATSTPTACAPIGADTAYTQQVNTLTVPTSSSQGSITIGILIGAIVGAFILGVIGTHQVMTRCTRRANKDVEMPQA